MTLQTGTQLNPQIIAAIIAFIATVIAAIIALIATVGVFVGGKILDARSANHAVLAEIKRLIQVVESHRDWWASRVAAGDTNYPLIPFSHGDYSKQVENIGLFSGALAVKTVQFYGYLDFLNSLQGMRDKFIAAGKSTEFDKMYANSLDSFTSAYAHAFKADFAKLR